MIVVLAEPEDTDALWLATALRAAGPVEVVLPEELLVGAALTCRTGSATTSARLELADGRVLGDGSTRLVVNRLDALPAPAGLAARDAAYVAEEWRAACTAWLRALPCPVLNPPRASSVAGPALRPAAWRAAAAAHGLPCTPWHSSAEPASTGSAGEEVAVTVVRDRCLAPGGRPVGQGVAAPLRALAAALGTPLLGALFVRWAGGWALADLTARPALRPLGEAGAAAVAACALPLVPAGQP